MGKRNIRGVGGFSYGGFPMAQQTLSILARRTRYPLGFSPARGGKWSAKLRRRTAGEFEGLFQGCKDSRCKV